MPIGDSVRTFSVKEESKYIWFSGLRIHLWNSTTMNTLLYKEWAIIYSWVNTFWSKF
jgi:hypothetical protein